MKANLPQREPQMIADWDKSELYKNIIKVRAGKPRFTLHDGPPYANGNIHLGTALNKILKDIIIKSKNMQDFASHYVPGWDCHGLPIEFQISKELGDKAKTMPVVSFRKACRKYADKWISIQRKEFIRLGVLGQWEDPYITMSLQYEAAIAREFGRVVGSKGVYKGSKPVYWCADCKTALAEAEIEYHDHVTPSIYVKFPMESDISAKVPEAAGKKIFVVIWTTTPWTIPANLALAFHPELDYALLDVGDDTAYILADLMAPAVFEEVEITDYKKLATFKGAIMDREKARHAYIDRESLCVLADYVTLDAGTGVVHTAPGHGRDDYETGLKYNLPGYAPVDEKGKFTSDVPEFEGQMVFDANPEVIKFLDEKGVLLHQAKNTHSYPHCWRCKKPIVFRSTPQWFLSMEKADLRKKAMEEIERVKWVPNWGHERIFAMMSTRPDWCLSRQRTWGIPIIAFTCKDCGEVILDKDVIFRVADIFEKETSDAWFEKTAKELLPEGTRCAKCSGNDFEKESDILDVWFDSGVSHAAVCEPNENLGWPVDLYLEGSDQHRGWFNTSLLTGVATRNRAPFETVLTHGFVVTGDGLKMSKSLGNAIAPSEIIDKFGAEILRLWVAGEDYREDIRISDQIIKGLIDSYRRIRNTCRFLLANIGDFDPNTHRVAIEEMSEIDKWALAKMDAISQKVIKGYNEYEFHNVFQTLHHLCAVELSSFYLDVCKDRLYASATDDLARRSSQTAMFDVLVRLIKLLAPICSFTSEEVWGMLPDFKGKTKSIHLALFDSINKDVENPKLLAKWDEMLKVRKEINKAIEAARREKIIGHNLDATIRVEGGDATATLNSFEPLLKEIMIVSHIERAEDLGGEGVYKSDIYQGLKVKVEKCQWAKCSRCWGYFPEVGTLENTEVCSRCSDVLERIG